MIFEWIFPIVLSAFFQDFFLKQKLIMEASWPFCTFWDILVIFLYFVNIREKVQSRPILMFSMYILINNTAYKLRRKRHPSRKVLSEWSPSFLILYIHNYCKSLSLLLVEKRNSPFWGKKHSKFIFITAQIILYCTVYMFMNTEQ